MVARSAEPGQLRAASAAQPGGAPAGSRAPWQAELARAHTRVSELLAALALAAGDIPDLDPAAAGFALRVPRPFAALMRQGDPADPLLRQVLPLGVESLPAPGFVLDPVGDGPATRLPGLIHKYHGRALLIAHGACAVHCRYCFRRHFPYEEMGPWAPRLERALQTLSDDTDITEVILSGGDPLMLDDDALGALIERLGGIPHLRRVRVHTRLPVVLPARVTAGLAALLGGCRPRVTLVIHANHPRELGGACPDALARLHGAGVTLLNQGVLLAGVNDSAQTLEALSEVLFEHRVLPYYLHQLDPVQGAARFAVDDARARTLHGVLRRRLPGYLVPRLVREHPGEPFKRPL